MPLTNSQANEFIGIESKQIEGPDAVCEQIIRHWTEIMEDSNPLYQDKEYAKSSKYDGIIAPPMQVQVYTMGPLWPKSTEELTSQGELIALLEKEGYTSIVATEQSQEYFEPMRLGDKIFRSFIVETISPKKQTSRGPGYFVTSLHTFKNQHQEIICKQSFTILIYNSKTS